MVLNKTWCTSNFYAFRTDQGPVELWKPLYLMGRNIFAITFLTVLEAVTLIFKVSRGDLSVKGGTSSRSGFDSNCCVCFGKILGRSTLLQFVKTTGFGQINLSQPSRPHKQDVYLRKAAARTYQLMAATSQLDGNYLKIAIVTELLAYLNYDAPPL